MKDESVSIHSYQKDGEGGEENTTCLNTSDHLAHNFLNNYKIITAIDIEVLTILTIHMLINFLTIRGPNDQYLVRISTRVSGMVKVHKRMSEMASMVMNTLRVVNITCNFYIYKWTFVASGLKVGPQIRVPEKSNYLKKLSGSKYNTF